MPNPNLTSGQLLPGFYAFIDYNAQGSSQAPTKRCLLWGYINSSAIRTPNQPFLPGSKTEADAGCGRGSDLARAYAAALTPAEASGAEIWLMPIVAPSGGTAATYSLKVYVANTNPAKAGTIQLAICSQLVPAVGFTTSDTDSSIATAIAAAINTMKDLPIGTVTSSGAVVSIPYMHKGTTGEDFPIRCNISPDGTGVTLSPGQLVLSGTAGAGGSIVVAFGAISISTAISNSDTAPTIAANVVASFNADTDPVKAVVDGGSSSQVNFLFNNDMDVRRMSAYIATTTTTTANLGSGATSGAGSSSSLTYNGTVGVGNPSLTAALTNMSAKDLYRSWAAPWLDTTTLGALATHIEANSDGSISGQKQQVLKVCGFRPASVEGAIPPTCSPNLTTTPPHYGYGWAPDAPIQGLEISARVASAAAAIWYDTPQFNWNGYPLRGSVFAPILLPPNTPSLDAQNTALRTYGLFPVVKGPSGNLEIVKGRTTSLASDLRLWAWSTETQAAYHSVDLGIFLRGRFQGGSIVRHSEPKAPKIFDKASFESAMQERMRFWENQGNYDGADALKNDVLATPFLANPFRFNLEYPESPVLDLDQVCFTGHFTSPSQ